MMQDRSAEELHNIWAEAVKTKDDSIVMSCAITIGVEAGLRVLKYQEKLTQKSVDISVDLRTLISEIRKIQTILEKIAHNQSIYR